VYIKWNWEESLDAKNQLDSSSCFDIIPFL